MYIPEEGFFFAEPPKCMSRTVERIVKSTYGYLQRNLHTPGHVTEADVVARDLPGYKAHLMVMRAPIDRMESILRYTRIPRDGDIFKTIDEHCGPTGQFTHIFKPQVEYLSPKPSKVDKYFFTFDAIDFFCNIIGYEGPIPHNNPTPASYYDPRDPALAAKITKARYAKDMALYELVSSRGGFLHVPPHA